VDDRAPYEIDLFGDDVAENAAIGTRIGRVQAWDTDTADDHITYQLVGTNAGKFQLVNEAGSLYLHTKAVFDREAAAVLPVTIRATDSGGRHYDKTFSIAIEDENEAPVFATGPTSFSIVGGTTIVTTFAATDPEGEGIGWSLQPSDNSADFV